MKKKIKLEEFNYFSLINDDPMILAYIFNQESLEHESIEESFCSGFIFRPEEIDSISFEDIKRYISGGNRAIFSDELIASRVSIRLNKNANKIRNNGNSVFDLLQVRNMSYITMIFDDGSTKSIYVPYNGDENGSNQYAHSWRQNEDLVIEICEHPIMHNIFGPENNG